MRSARDQALVGVGTLAVEWHCVQYRLRPRPSDQKTRVRWRVLRMLGFRHLHKELYRRRTSRLAGVERILGVQYTLRRWAAEACTRMCGLSRRVRGRRGGDHQLQRWSIQELGFLG